MSEMRKYRVFLAAYPIEDARAQVDIETPFELDHFEDGTLVFYQADEKAGKVQQMFAPGVWKRVVLL